MAPGVLTQKFIFDFDVSWRLAGILAILYDSLDIQCVGRSPCPLPCDASDEELICYGAKNDRIIVSRDDTQLGRLPTAATIIENGARLIYVTKGIPTRDPRLQAIWLLSNWPDLLTIAESLNPGHAITIRKNGTFRIVTVRTP